MPLDQPEDYVQNLLALKSFVETNLDEIKKAKIKIDPLKHSATLADFDKFLKAAEALIEETPSAVVSDPLALENIKSFFDERQGESQCYLLEKTIGNRADIPAVELLYFIQGIVFELDPKLESVANRDARLLHMVESSNANGTSLQSPEDDAQLLRRFEALRESSVTPIDEVLIAEGLEKKGGKKSIKNTEEFKTIEAFYKKWFSDSAPAQKVPPLTLVVGKPSASRLPPALPLPPPSNTPLTFMPHADYVKRLEKISGKTKKRVALTTETALAHLQAAEKKINAMRELSSKANMDKTDDFKAALASKFSEKIDKWEKAKSDPTEQAAHIKNHLEHKANTALLHQDYHAKIQDLTDGNSIDLVIQKKNEDGTLQDCIKESFHKKSQTVTVDVFSIENNDLHKAVELALKACPEGGHVTIDDELNPERALKIFLFAKAAGGNDKFRFGTGTESQVKQHLEKTDLNEEQQGLKALYQQVVATVPMTPEQIRESLVKITQKDIKCPKL